MKNKTIVIALIALCLVGCTSSNNESEQVHNSEVSNEYTEQSQDIPEPISNEEDEDETTGWYKLTIEGMEPFEGRMVSQFSTSLIKSSYIIGLLSDNLKSPIKKGHIAITDETTDEDIAIAIDFREGINVKTGELLGKENQIMIGSTGKFAATSNVTKVEISNYKQKMEGGLTLINFDIKTQGVLTITEGEDKQRTANYTLEASLQ